MMTQCTNFGEIWREWWEHRMGSGSHAKFHPVGGCCNS